MIVGTALTVILIGWGALVPQLLLTVISPLYVPGAVVTDTGIGIGLDGSAAVVKFVKPAGDPVHAML